MLDFAPGLMIITGLPRIQHCMRITGTLLGASASKRCGNRTSETARSCVVARSLSDTMGTIVTKDELRAELERQAQRYTDVYGGEVITYAAQPDPERKPWRKKASLLDQAFDKEIEKIEKDLSSKQEASAESA